MADRQPLTARDLAPLAQIVGRKHAAAELFAAADDLVRRKIGYKLFSIMRVHAASAEVERLHSSNPAAYPVGGRKKKQDTQYGRVAVDEGEVFLARTPEELKAAFADHALIFSLGLGSSMNVPIVHAGRRLGSMNALHEANWFTPQDVENGRVIAALLVPALLT